MRANFGRIGLHISISYALPKTYFNSDARKPVKIAEVKNPCDKTSVLFCGLQCRLSVLIISRPFTSFDSVSRSFDFRSGLVKKKTGFCVGLYHP